MAPPTRTAVGRDALIPPHPAPPRTPAGGYGIRPYNQRWARGQPGNRCPCVIINLCRGRCSHRPGGPYAARTPAGGINPAPTNKFCVWGQTGTAAAFRAAVGRDALIPPHPAAAQTPAGGYGIRPYNRRKARGQTGKRATARPRGRAMALPYKPSEMPRQTGTAVTIRATVGRDALIPPHPAAPQTPPGGYGIRPYE